jgi:hypothetical protein
MTGSILELGIAPFFVRDTIDRTLEDTVQSTEKKSSAVTQLTELLQDEDYPKPVTLGTMDRLAFDYLHRFRVGGHFTLVKGYH